MSQSLASLNILHLRNQAIFNKQYFADNGRVYIGTKDGKLKLEDKAVETSFSPTTTIPETNVQDAIESLSSGSNIGLLLTDTATINFTYNPVVPASITADLRNTAVIASSYGLATSVPQIVIDSQGRITSASNVAIISPTSVIVNDILTAVPVYPTWVTANSGSLPLFVSSTKISFIPSTGLLQTNINSVLDYIQTTAASTPTTPTVGNLKFWNKTTNGIESPYWMGSDGLSIRGNRDLISTVRNTSGGTLVAGDVVYISGATGTAPNVAKAKANSATTMPAAGVVMHTITNNSFGRIQRFGRNEFGFDTSAFVIGEILYVSEITAGLLTNIRPAHPNLNQEIGIVVISGVGNGSIFISVNDQQGYELGTNLNTFAIGSGLVGTKTLSFVNTFTSQLQWTPTAARVLTLPDSTGTLATLAGFEALSNKTGLISQWTNDTGYLTSVALTAGQIGFGSAGNVLTSDPTFTWNNTAKDFTITGTIGQVLSNTANVWYVAQGNVGYWFTGAASTGLLNHQGFGIDFKTNNIYTMGDVGIINNTNIQVNDTAQTITLTHGGLLTTGTIGSGLWNGTVISPVYGGTGVANNIASTLTISGSFATTLTVTAGTSVTLPVSGTLYGTLAGSITSAQLASSLTDETGTLLAVFSDSPTFTTQIISPLIYGSTAANGDITIEGTSSATKTTSYVNIQTTGGNVGIGTTAPAYQLHVEGTVATGSGVRHRIRNLSNNASTYTVLEFGNDASSLLGGFFVTSSTNTAYGGINSLNLLNITAAPLVFGTTNTVRMTIAAGGNVGIGTPTPTAILHLKAGTGTANTAPLQFTSGTVETVARAGVMEYNGQFSLVPTDATRRFITLAASSIKTVAGAPYVNDGYITLNINGTDIKIMTTA